MSTDVMTASAKNLELALGQLDDDLNAMMAIPIVSEGGNFLKFVKGEWFYGADETEPHPKSIWAMNPLSIERGFMAWATAEGDNTLYGERFAKLGEASILPAELPAHDNAKWVAAMSIQLVCVSGEDAGAMVKFSTTSRGGLVELKRVLSAIAARRRAGESAVVPLVVLSATHYKHPTYGRIYTPVFDEQEWRGLDDVEPPQAEAPQAEAPQAEAPQAEAPPAEPTVEELKAQLAALQATNAAEEPVEPPTPGRRQRRFSS